MKRFGEKARAMYQGQEKEKKSHSIKVISAPPAKKLGYQPNSNFSAKVQSLTTYSAPTKPLGRGGSSASPKKASLMQKTLNQMKQIKYVTRVMRLIIP
jgi:hypothetical protein